MTGELRNAMRSTSILNRRLEFCERTVLLTPATVAIEIVRSYLFHAGTAWSPSAFARVWELWTALLAPLVRELSVAVTAPVFGIGKHFDGRFGLAGSDWVFASESPERAAEIANAAPLLAGHTEHGFRRRWTTQFLHRVALMPKQILRPDDQPKTPTPGAMPRPHGELHRETVLLRVFCHETVSVPRYAALVWPHATLFPLEVSGHIQWRVHPPTSGAVTPESVRLYRRRRHLFVQLTHHRNWWSVYGSMRRFAAAWENPFPADRLADIVAALESLVVGYNVRVRVARLIGKRPERASIVKDIADAYGFRSTVAHGGFVLDTPGDWPEFQKRSGKKPKDPFKDVREIQRLTHRVSDLYRRSVLAVVRRKLEVDWSATGV